MGRSSQDVRNECNFCIVHLRIFEKKKINKKHWILVFVFVIFSEFITVCNSVTLHFIVLTMEVIKIAIGED